jgi:hypothetical protein
MKKASVVLLFLSFFSYIYGSPDRGVWVIDQLIGFRDDSMILKQIVTDNEGSHYQSHIETYIIEKNMRTNEVISIDRIAYVEYHYNTANMKTETIGRSEDKLRELIEKRPSVFYELDYAVPLGIPNNESQSIFLDNGVIIDLDKKETREAKYNVRDVIPEKTIKEKVKNLLQVYEYRDFFIVLVDFGDSFGDTNYYQKIIAFKKK